MKSFKKYIPEQRQLTISDFSNPANKPYASPSGDDINQALSDAGLNPDISSDISQMGMKPSPIEPNNPNPSQNPNEVDDYPWAEGTIFLQNGSMAIPCDDCPPQQGCPPGYQCFPCSYTGTCQWTPEDMVDEIMEQIYELRYHQGPYPAVYGPLSDGSYWVKTGPGIIVPWWFYNPIGDFPGHDPNYDGPPRLWTMPQSDNSQQGDSIKDALKNRQR
tara:strand:+ start:83 stop:733 length:651 start_codon:yes stop_codon:yes gene_type:complete